MNACPVKVGDNEQIKVLVINKNVCFNPHDSNMYRAKDGFTYTNRVIRYSEVLEYLKKFKEFIDNKKTDFKYLSEYYEEICKALIVKLKEFDQRIKGEWYPAIGEDLKNRKIYHDLYVSLRMKKLKYEGRMLEKSQLLYSGSKKTPNIVNLENMRLLTPYLSGDLNLDTFKKRLEKERADVEAGLYFKKSKKKSRTKSKKSRK